MTDAPQGRERSTIRFPYGDLDDALVLARTIHEKFGLSCSLDQLAAGMGQSVSGAFRNKVATASTFGVIATVRGGVELTDLGLRALDDRTEASAKVEAFLAVPLYAAVYERFRGRQIPSDQGFESELVKLGVSPKVSSKARQAMQRSAESAGFFAMGRDRLVEPATDKMPSVAVTEFERASDNEPAPPTSPGAAGMHPLLVGLWQELPDPKAGDFNTTRQTEWLDAAKVVLKLLYGGSATSASVAKVAERLAPSEVDAPA